MPARPPDPPSTFDRQLEAWRIGLCVRCAHGLRTPNDRGSVFYRCGHAAVDARFPKYPITPVVRCPAFTPSPRDA
jgi:hypothetical protein